MGDTRWFPVDGARDFLGGRDTISRKAVYAMVNDGMKVARLGEAGRRLMFCDTWISEYLESKADRKTA